MHACVRMHLASKKKSKKKRKKCFLIRSKTLFNHFWGVEKKFCSMPPLHTPPTSWSIYPKNMLKIAKIPFYGLNTPEKSSKRSETNFKVFKKVF